MKDPRSPRARTQRLDFFYKKHPSWDAQLGLGPRLPLHGMRRRRLRKRRLSTLPDRACASDSARAIFAKKLFELTGFVPDRRLSHRAPVLELPGGRTGRRAALRHRRQGPADQPDHHLLRDRRDRPAAALSRRLRPVRRHAGAPQRRRLRLRAQLAVPVPARHRRHPHLLYRLSRVEHAACAPLPSRRSALCKSSTGSRSCRRRTCTTTSSTTHFGIQVFWIYLVGICCAVFHFCNGLWNLAYHWGLTVSPRSQRLWGYACGLIGVTLLAVGARVAARLHRRSA